MGTTLTEIALEAARQGNLAERAPTGASSPRAGGGGAQSVSSPTFVRRGRDVNNTVVVGERGDVRIFRTPIDNIGDATRLADSIRRPGDGAVTNGIRQLSTKFILVAQNDMIYQSRD